MESRPTSRITTKLYRDDDGHEVWAIYRDGQLYLEGIASDHDKAAIVAELEDAPGSTEQTRHDINLDPGLLREQLAEIYTNDFLSPSTARRANLMVHRISRLTGISREQVEAAARADAEAMG